MSQLKPIKLKRVKARILNIVDGDTLDAEFYWYRFLFKKKKQVRIRFAGIDTPEMKPTPEPFAQEAVNYVKRAVYSFGQRITVEFATDKKTGEWIYESGGTWNHRRLLGIIYVGRKNLNVELVRLGLAKIYERPTWMVTSFEESLRKAEGQAKKKQIGIWKSQEKVKGKKNILGAVFFWVVVIVIALTFFLGE